MIVPSGDIGSLITAAAAIAGAGVGWLASWTAGRRSRAEARDDRRRGAYGAFIGAAEEILHLLTYSGTMKTAPTPDSLFGENLAQAVGSVDRAYVGVLLAGPEAAWTVADEVRQGCWALLTYLSPEPGETTPAPQNALAGFASLCTDYARACDKFTRAAQRILGD